MSTISDLPAARKISRPPALAAWAGEIAAGRRRNTVTNFDHLAAAAAAEYTAREAERRGDRAAAERWYATAWCRLAGCWDAPDSPAGRRALEWFELAAEELEREEARPAPPAPAPARRVVPLHRRPPAPPPASWAPRRRAGR